jgi:TetR/AcrR family transcriptional regulator, tetracycline repressor protein
MGDLEVPMSLSRETIIQEAIALLNHQGIDSLTMRELAKRLNIKAASLYWHIKNKEELFSLIAESICQGIPLDRQVGNARGRIREMIFAYRDNLLKVRDSEKILYITLPMTPARIELIKAMLDSLEELGVPRDKLIQTGNLLNNFVLSFVAEEVRITSLDRIETAFFFDLPMNLDFHSQFTYGLEVLLNGIEITR